MINYCINYVKAKINNEKGQGMVEYALLIGLIAILLIASITLMKGSIETKFTQIKDALS